MSTKTIAIGDIYGGSQHLWKLPTILTSSKIIPALRGNHKPQLNKKLGKKSWKGQG